MDDQAQVLAVDIGSSSIRAALIAADGTVAAEAREPAPEVQRAGQAAELDPTGWWQAVCRLASELAVLSPRAFRRVAVVAVCGATRVQVLLDAAGLPVRPALHWSDARAEQEARRISSLASGHAEQAHINVFHPLVRLAHIAAAEPAAFARTAFVVDPKDFVNARLTGRIATDPVSLARLAAAGEASGNGRDLITAVAGRSGFLPPFLEPWQIVGPMKPGLPAPFSTLAGVPVCCGSHDTFAAVVGLGAMRAGYAYNISGTTEVLGVLSDKPEKAEGLISIDWRAAHQLGGPSQNGADVAKWLAGILDRADQDVALDTLLAGERAAQPLLFLPYLSGERVPYWDADLRGAFIGLSRAHGATDLAYAVLEGVAFQNRLVLERAEAATGGPITELRFGGGGAANKVWRQIKADVLGRKVVVTEADEPGLLGAAALGFVAVGRYPTLAAAQGNMVRAAAQYVPDAGRAIKYDALYRMFRAAETALASVSRGLVGFAP